MDIKVRIKREYTARMKLFYLLRCSEHRQPQSTSNNDFSYVTETSLVDNALYYWINVKRDLLKQRYRKPNVGCFSLR